MRPRGLVAFGLGQGECTEQVIFRDPMSEAPQLMLRCASSVSFGQGDRPLQIFNGRPVTEPDNGGLSPHERRRFIETEVLPWFDEGKQELANRPRKHAVGAHAGLFWPQRLSRRHPERMRGAALELPGGEFVP